ncbi:UDP-glucuronate 4-epimerase 4 [Lamellibrachia satsuma]|nr:UDP-glucuronate 4-epimerase 4 [Lamellibrachia satsuma]
MLKYAQVTAATDAWSSKPSDVDRSSRNRIRSQVDHTRVVGAAFVTAIDDTMQVRRHSVLNAVAGFCLASMFIWLLVQMYPQISDYTTVTIGMHRPKTPTVRSNEAKRVLVTGAAGFIGFHLAKTLASTNNTVIVGMDNFNDYYDVQLKKDRAFALHNLGVTVYHEDLCHTEFLEDIFVKYNFTHVTHLAAQAGVRYSLENPLAYIRANVECQVALLEVLRKYPKIKLVYASSSSVYGKHTPVPFQLTARTDRPGNMYAATKETDELLANYYCHAYDMSAVGLRFFTVYGPWGRPDMATYKFAEAMVNDKEVPMFHVSDDKPLERDFTYVDDIISGVTMAMDYIPAECGEKFNLGFGQPVSVPAMINILKTELQVKAKVKKLPLPPTEILKTWADTSVSQELLHFQPSTNLQQGVKKFVEWFKQYAQERKAKKSDPNVQKWFNGLLKDRDSRDSHYENKKMLQHNIDLHARLARDRQRYADWANTQGIHLPTLCEVKFTVDKKTDAFQQTCPCKPGYQKQGRNCIPIYGQVAVSEQEFQKELPKISELKKGQDMIFFQGLTAKGVDSMYVPNAAKLNHDKLQEICKKDKLCIAITTDGWMKRQVISKDWWSKVFSKNAGIFVFDIDYCSLGETTCPHHSRCTRVAKGDYRCVCEAPLVMSNSHRCEKTVSTKPSPNEENVNKQKTNSGTGTKPNPNKTVMIDTYPVPKDKMQVRRFT